MTKITISGSEPKFDAQVLKELQAGYHNVYNNTDQHCTVVRDELAYNFLAKVVEMSEQGYILTSRYPVSTAVADYSAFMIKPSHIQAADLAIIDDEVKQKYIADLELERERYRQLVTPQLLQKAELAEAKKVADKQSKLLAEVQKEVNDLFGDLVIPS